MPSGKTSFVDNHSHDYTVNNVGTGSTSVNDGHQHRIVTFDVKRADGHTHTIPKTGDSKHLKKGKKKK